jgi:RNA-binding protein 25
MGVAAEVVGAGARAGAVSTSMDVDEKPNIVSGPKKLGFGLMGAGKRAVVPSVFTKEDEEDIPKDRGLRQLVPIEYTAEEMEAVTKSSTTVGLPPNLAAAAEFAKSLSKLATKEEPESDKRGRQGEKSKERSQREEDRSKDERSKDRGRDEDREKGKHRHSDGGREKEQSGPAKLDAKQLIDTIPKTKEELFGYKIDWKIYDQVLGCSTLFLL